MRTAAGTHSFYLSGWRFVADSIWLPNRHSQFFSPLLASLFAFTLSLAARGGSCSLVLAKGTSGKVFSFFPLLAPPLGYVRM